MIKRIKYWRGLFYAGPRFLGIAPPRYNGWQSPTVTAALWAYALIMRHFTLAGRVIFACSGLLVLYAMFSLLMPIHLLAFAVLALFTFDFVVGYLVRPRLRASRTIPARVRAGTEQRVDYHVANKANRPAWDVCLDSLPYPKGVSLSRGAAFLEALGPGETARAHAYVTAARRGRHTLPAMRADSAFPFNLWRWGSSGEGAQSLVVYPDFTPLTELALRAGVRYQPGGIALSSNVGESMEFLGCREFRDGDDPRRLHWRSWARTSYPVTKEFREEYLCRTALIVDTYRPRGRRLDFYLFDLFYLLHPPREDDAFEAALSLAAAIADFLAGSDYIVDLFAAGPEVYRFQGGRSLAYLENILDILACLAPHTDEPFSEFSDALIEEIAQISSAVFVLLTWNDTRKKLIEDVAAAGVTVRALLVTDSEELPPDLPSMVTTLSARDIRLGPSLPAFVTPDVLQVLVDNFNIMPISTPEEDLRAILGE